MTADNLLPLTQRTSASDRVEGRTEPDVPLEEAIGAAVDFMQLLEGDRRDAETLDLLIPTPASAPLPRPSIDALRGALRRGLRERGPNLDIRVAAVTASETHMEFRLVVGQWVTSRTHMLVVGDDAEDVSDVVARALVDLLEDMITHPAM